MIRPATAEALKPPVSIDSRRPLRPEQDHRSSLQDKLARLNRYFGEDDSLTRLFAETDTYDLAGLQAHFVGMLTDICRFTEGQIQFVSCASVAGDPLAAATVSQNRLIYVPTKPGLIYYSGNIGSASASEPRVSPDVDFAYQGRPEDIGLTDTDVNSRGGTIVCPLTSGRMSAGEPIKTFPKHGVVVITGVEPAKFEPSVDITIIRMVFNAMAAVMAGRNLNV